jgi:hypothetical protein
MVLMDVVDGGKDFMFLKITELNIVRVSEPIDHPNLIPLFLSHNVSEMSILFTIDEQRAFRYLFGRAVKVVHDETK